MAYLVRMPKLGMEMQEGALLEWKVDEGEHVDEGVVLAEIESEKSVRDVPARESGVLRRRVLEEGATVSPGTPMGVVAGASEPIDDLLSVVAAHDETPDLAETGGAASAGDPPAPADADAGVTTATGGTASEDGADGAEPAGTGGGGAATAATAKVSPRARKRAEELGVDVDFGAIEGSGVEGSVIEADVERIAGASTGGDGAAPTADAEPADPAPADVKATPEAERRASELDVPLAEVDGTGPAGTVRAADVEDVAVAAAGDATTRQDTAAGPASGTPATPPASEAPGPATRTVAREETFSGMRQTIAERLGTSWREAPHVTVSRAVPVGEALEAAEVADDALDVDVSIVDVLLLALSATLDDHPAFNATLEDGVHRIYEEHNVGLAVDVEAGLVTPVLDRVDERSLAGVATRRRELIDRARDGDYTMDDMRGGTVTVTNLGALGVDAFTPIINPPEVAILGVNRVREVPRPAADGDGVDFQSTLRLDLSFDHRAVDGADAARFLETFEARLTDPWELLLSR